MMMDSDRDIVDIMDMVSDTIDLDNPAGKDDTPLCDPLFVKRGVIDSSINYKTEDIYLNKKRQRDGKIYNPTAKYLKWRYY